MTPFEAPIKNKTLRIGHTPDPDDAFMFYGFASGKVSIPGYDIEHVLEDIQTLNGMTMRNEIEVSAVSAAIYPAIRRHYWILPMGASVGRNYGPVVVKRAGEHPSTKKIGIPGKHTTAYLLLKLLAPGYEPVECRFDEIPEKLKAGEVDYGLLIHEAQITYETMGFEKIVDLGEAWMNETQLPIPLGLDVVNKSLGREFALTVAQALGDSIKIAHTERDPAVEYSLKFGRGLAKPLGDRFVGMYVNNDTINMGDDCEKALNLLFDKAYRAGIYPSPTIVDILRP
jgi:1,4-dihydroxy-6-naphthoate synthase